MSRLHRRAEPEPSEEVTEVAADATTQLRAAMDRHVRLVAELSDSTAHLQDAVRSITSREKP